METFWKIYAAYGQIVITDWQVWNWIAKFRSGEMSLGNESRQSHLSNETLKRLVESSPLQSAQTHHNLLTFIKDQ